MNLKENNFFQVSENKEKINFFLIKTRLFKKSFNEYKFIKYKNCGTFENIGNNSLQELNLNENDHYHHFEFQNLNLLLYLKDDFICFLEKIFNQINSEDDLENKIIEINNFFNKSLKKINEEKLLGDLGEALFIKKCCDLGIGKEALSAHSKNEEGTYDFNPPNKLSIEIKTFTSSSKEINISLNQMKDSHILTVELIKVENKITINDIYDEIKMHYSGYIPQLLEEKMDKYKNCDQTLVNQFCINDFDSVKFNFFDNNDLPEIEIIKGKYKDIIFVLDASISMLNKKEIDKKIKELF